MFDALVENARPLAERVADQIIQQILDSKLQAGEKLPNEFELAQSLKVGRGTVREAVKLLESKNILEIRRGKGTFVAQRPGVLEDPLGLAFYRNKFQLAMDLLELRLMIEPEIARMAARRATPEDVEEMRRICLVIEEEIKHQRDYSAYDKELHTCIARSTKNQVLPSLLPMVSQAIGLFIDLTNRELWKETIETHRGLVEAIAVGDGETARSAMIKHLRYNATQLEKARAEKEQDHRGRIQSAEVTSGSFDENPR